MLKRSCLRRSRDSRRQPGAVAIDDRGRSFAAISSSAARGRDAFCACRRRDAAADAAPGARHDGRRLGALQALVTDESGRRDQVVAVRADCDDLLGLIDGDVPCRSASCTICVNVLPPGGCQERVRRALAASLLPRSYASVAQDAGLTTCVQGRITRVESGAKATESFDLTGKSALSSPAVTRAWGLGFATGLREGGRQRHDLGRNERKNAAAAGKLRQHARESNRGSSTCPSSTKSSMASPQRSSRWASSTAGSRTLAA